MNGIRSYFIGKRIHYLSEEVDHFVRDGTRQLGCSPRFATYTNEGCISDEQTLADLLNRNLKAGLTRGEIVDQAKSIARGYHSKLLGDRLERNCLESLFPGLNDWVYEGINRRIQLIYALPKKLD